MGPTKALAGKWMSRRLELSRNPELEPQGQGHLPPHFQVMIREKNPEGFLSAAEMPLFKLYLTMSACFLAAGIFWVSVLCKNT